LSKKQNKFNNDLKFFFKTNVLLVSLQPSGAPRGQM